MVPASLTVEDLQVNSNSSVVIQEQEIVLSIDTLPVLISLVILENECLAVKSDTHWGFITPSRAETSTVHSFQE